MNDNQGFSVSSKEDIWGNLISVVGEGICGKIQVEKKMSLDYENLKRCNAKGEKQHMMPFSQVLWKSN